VHKDDAFRSTVITLGDVQGSAQREPQFLKGAGQQLMSATGGRAAARCARAVILLLCGPVLFGACGTEQAGMLDALPDAATEGFNASMSNCDQEFPNPEFTLSRECYVLGTGIRGAALLDSVENLTMSGSGAVAAEVVDRQCHAISEHMDAELCWVYLQVSGSGHNIVVETYE